jgi:hypothetical protein
MIIIMIEIMIIIMIMIMILLVTYLFLHVRQNHDPFLRPRDAVVAALAY